MSERSELGKFLIENQIFEAAEITDPKLKLIDNVWKILERHVTKRKGKKIVHKTIMQLNNLKLNQDISDDLFTIRRLEKGL